MPEWRETKPQGTDYIGEGAKVIRDFKECFKYLYEKEHDPAPIPINVSGGWHKEWSLRSGFVSPSSPQAGQIVHHTTTTSYPLTITQKIFTSSSSATYVYLNNLKHGKKFTIGTYSAKIYYFKYPPDILSETVSRSVILNPAYSITNDDFFKKASYYEIYLYARPVSPNPLLKIGAVPKEGTPTMIVGISLFYDSGALGYPYALFTPIAYVPTQYDRIYVELPIYYITMKYLFKLRTSGEFYFNNLNLSLFAKGGTAELAYVSTTADWALYMVAIPLYKNEVLTP